MFLSQLRVNLTKMGEEVSDENSLEFKAENEYPVLSRFFNKGEHVIAQYNNYYATNKRLIKYKEFLFWNDYDDMSYTHVSSIKFVRKINIPLLNLGMILMIIGIPGLILAAYGWGPAITAINQSGLFNLAWQGNIAWILAGFGFFNVWPFAIGMFLVILSSVFRFPYYELRGTGGERWRLSIRQQSVADSFIKIVRAKLK